MTFLKYLKLVTLFLISVPLWGAEDPGEENPLVADTFTKKKHVRYFGDYETVFMNYLEAGQIQATVVGGTIYSKVFIESTNASPTIYTIDSKGTQLLAGAAVKYGVSDNFSVVAQTTYVKSDSDSASVVSGTPSSSESRLSGIRELILRAQVALALSSFGYFGDVSFTPSLEKSTFNAQTREGNTAQDQASLAIQNFLILDSGYVKWGPILAYRYYFDGQEEQISSTGTSTTNDISGGNTLTAAGFIEFEKLYNTNFQFGYLKSDSTTDSRNGVVLSESPALDYINVLASMKFNVSRKVSLVPQFQYATVLNKNVDSQYSYTQFDLFGISAEVRILF